MDVPHLKIALSDVSIVDAANAASDGAKYYIETLPAILHLVPGVTVRDYWSLTVAEHQALAEFAAAYSQGVSSGA